MDLGSEKTFGIIEHVLEKRIFSQRSASRETGISLGQLNKVVAWLKLHNFVRTEKNSYVVSDPSGVISAIAVFRHMEELKVLSINVRLGKKEVLEMLPKGCILCMESALDFYASAYVGNRVCIYADEKLAKAIKGKFAGYGGNQTILAVYKPAQQIKKEKRGSFYISSKVRTVIDLVCDDKAFAADSLFRQIWGAKFG